MKRLLAVFMAFCVMAPSVCYAEEGYETSISLCYDGDAYSVDYVFEVTGDASVTDVTLDDNNCYFAWNYVASEARLYLSLASGNVIAKADTIATVVTDAETELLPVSIVVDGKIKNGAYAFHETVVTEGLDPTIDVPGYTRSEKCERCDLMIVESEPIPALGPDVEVVLDEDGVLSVKGALSDDSAAKGVTFVAVYDDNNQMLCLEDATDVDQADFSVQIENAADAAVVKIFRFEAEGHTPLFKVAVADVIKE